MTREYSEQEEEHARLEKVGEHEEFLTSLGFTVDDSFGAWEEYVMHGKTKDNPEIICEIPYPGSKSRRAHLQIGFILDFSEKIANIEIREYYEEKEEKGGNPEDLFKQHAKIVASQFLDSWTKEVSWVDGGETIVFPARTRSTPKKSSGPGKKPATLKPATVSEYKAVVGAYRNASIILTMSEYEKARERKGNLRKGSRFVIISEAFAGKKRIDIKKHKVQVTEKEFATGKQRYLKKYPSAALESGVKPSKGGKKPSSKIAEPGGKVTKTVVEERSPERKIVVKEPYDKPVNFHQYYKNYEYLVNLMDEMVKDDGKSFVRFLKKHGYEVEESTIHEKSQAIWINDISIDENVGRIAIDWYENGNISMVFGVYLVGDAYKTVEETIDAFNDDVNALLDSKTFKKLLGFLKGRKSVLSIDMFSIDGEEGCEREVYTAKEKDERKREFLSIGEKRRVIWKIINKKYPEELKKVQDRWRTAMISFDIF